MPTDRRTASPLRGLLTLRPAPPRWPLATRVAFSSAIPILIGWAAGDIGAGLIASLGAFTCAYASDRPYYNRGAQSAVVAVALATSVTVGAWAADVTWLAVAAVSVVAVAAVWWCSALDVGPPGAYMFVLVCAVGVGVSASHLAPWQIGLLVLAGGVVAWSAQMSAALLAPRGPEKAAVAAAGEAVADYLEHDGTRDSGVARRRAATALTRAWATLVDYQPRRTRPGPALRELRDANHALHVLFTEGMSAVNAGRPLPAGAAATARAVGSRELDPGAVRNLQRDRPPLRQPPARTRLARAVRPGTHTRRVMLRVAIAAPLAGTAAVVVGLGHEYWAMAAAVLVLHQGVDRVATLQRGTERLVGTVVGLGVAAVILSIHPQGLWLIVVVALLQFAIEMFVVRNYAIATVFITAIALTISSGTHRVDVGGVVADRGLDTVIGCGVAIVVYLVLAPRQEAHRIGEAIAALLEDAATATAFLARGDASSLAARGARRDLQDSVFDVVAAEQAARSGSRRDRAAAARLSAAVTAAEHLGYATVTAGWAAEQGSAEVFGSADPDAYVALLRRITLAVRDDTAPVAVADDTTPVAGERLPPFAAGEVPLLIEALRDGARARPGAR
ncbi:FUSC family protein [Mycolicibacterium palauense]|uniref:FUSC family protein n=1 Tax=Mycolicibacterium palauense TaxID=2034511 RepID=UPI000BFEDA93|nr:FUSC family protein [Mycolicibacterium palauense]